MHFKFSVPAMTALGQPGMNWYQNLFLNALWRLKSLCRARFGATEGRQQGCGGYPRSGFHEYTNSNPSLQRTKMNFYTGAQYSQKQLLLGSAVLGLLPMCRMPIGLTAMTSCPCFLLRLRGPSCDKKGKATIHVEPQFIWVYRKYSQHSHFHLESYFADISGHTANVKSVLSIHLIHTHWIEP